MYAERYRIEYNTGMRRKIRNSAAPKFVCVIPQILINLDPGTTFNPYESWEAEQAAELQANAVKTITE